ncbi:cell wall-associated NlpC family hydrolase [Paucibacter oligotrophus]|uniref:Cell wall-associated NlpC family hydrolase n=1 Tax=Roseateles oligotrophus TaxID=1769250 RepID=A0A840L165_9BURK|nr:cell wall-associated NlpC family hydrolase [Roseateles oligotrophus]
MGSGFARPVLLACALGILGTAALAQQSNASGKTPPPGTMTGAWGQSLLQSGSGSKPKNPSPAQESALPVQAKAPDAGPAPAAGLEAGPSAATANDPVSRFLQERGLLAQAQGESSKLLNQVRDGASDMVLSAMNFLGVRYTRGGNSAETGFDCSGFTRHIFENSVGLILPRRADEQAKMPSLLQVKKEELKPGDLVFFNTMRRTFSHVGIYVGEGKFIHSPRVGGAVRVEDMREAYWSKRFTGARRADLKNAGVGGD